MSERIYCTIRGDIIALYALRGYLAAQYPYHDIWSYVDGANDSPRMLLRCEPDGNLGLFDAGKIDSAIEWLASRNEVCKTLRADHA